LHDEEHVPVLEDSLRSGAHTIAEEVLPLVEETASIGKRQVVTGRVHMRAITDTVEESAHVEVQRETVEVTHVPIDRVVEITPEIRTEGDLTIVPALEEVLVVEKRLMLRERNGTSDATSKPRPSMCQSPYASSMSWSSALIQMIRPPNGRVRQLIVP
jgi:stress response protein YsnF